MHTVTVRDPLYVQHNQPTARILTGRAVDLSVLLAGRCYNLQQVIIEATSVMPLRTYSIETRRIWASTAE